MRDHHAAIGGRSGDHASHGERLCAASGRGLSRPCHRHRHRHHHQQHAEESSGRHGTSLPAHVTPVFAPAQLATPRAANAANARASVPAGAGEGSGCRLGRPAKAASSRLRSSIRAVRLPIATRASARLPTAIRDPRSAIRGTRFPVPGTRYPRLLLCDKDAACRAGRDCIAGRMSMTRYLALLTLFIATLGAGCSAPPAGESGATAPAAGSLLRAQRPATQVHDGRAIEITANDTMKFSVTEIARQARREAQRDARQHRDDAEVLDGPQLAAPGARRRRSAVPGRGGRSRDDRLRAACRRSRTDILAATKLLGPERARHRDVHRARRAGPLRRSSVRSPGHYQVGMRGVLIVE